MNKIFFFLILFLCPNLWSAEIPPVRPLGAFERARRDGFLPRSPRPIQLENSEQKLVAMPSINLGGSSQKMVYRTTTGEFGSLPLIPHLGNKSPKRTYLVNPDACYLHKGGCDGDGFVETESELLLSDTARKAGFEDVIQTVTKEPPYPVVGDGGDKIALEGSCWIKLEEGYESLLTLYREFDRLKKASVSVGSNEGQFDQNDFLDNFAGNHFKNEKYLSWFENTKEAFFKSGCIDNFFEDMKTICGNQDLKIDEESYFKIGAIRTYFRMEDDQIRNIMFNPATGKFFGIDHGLLCLKVHIIEELPFTYKIQHLGFDYFCKTKDDINAKNKKLDAILPIMHKALTRRIQDQKMFERVTTFLKYFKAVDAVFDPEEASRNYSNLHKDRINGFENVKSRAQMIIKDLEGMIKEYNDRSFFNNYCMELGRMFESFQE